MGMRVRLKTRYALTLLGLTLAVVIALSVAQFLEIRVVAGNLRDSTAISMDEALMRQYQQRAVALSTALSKSVVDAIYHLDVEEIDNLVSGLSALPDLRGFSLRVASRWLRHLGAEPRAEGAGVVRSQWPEPGVNVARGEVVRLQCKPARAPDQRASMWPR